MVLHKVSFSLLLLTVMTSSVVSSGLSYLGIFEEDEDCGINSEGDDYFGSCLKIEDCLSAFNEYKNNQRVLDVCSYGSDSASASGENLICCSNDDLENSKVAKRSLDYNECVERYLEYRPSSLNAAGVAHGVATNKGEFPNMVAIGWTQDDKSVEYSCGGSIITELFIVTAAHCTSDGGVRPDVVRIGDIDLLSNTDNEDVQQLNIARIIKHPLRSPQYDYYDLALIKVDREIKMNQYVAPACIQHGPTNNKFEAAGYGQTGYAEKKANKLMKVNLELVNQNDCKEYFHNFNEQKLGRGIVKEQFCAIGARYGGPEMDTCLGDSGGGLQYNNRITIETIVYQIPTLVGIVSFGIFCAQGAPSVNTNVPSYIDWMEKVIFP